MLDYSSGSIVHVDLSGGDTWIEPIDKELRFKYLSGRGIAAKYRWELYENDIDPLGEQNHLMFFTGVLVGTNAPLSGRTTITTKSPMTNQYLKSSVGGHLGVMLRMAGYEGLLIHSASHSPRYLYIDQNSVEIRDATHLWGKGIKETTRLLHKEHNTEELAVACIGPAGENLVKYACIMASYYHAAGRGGVGAVMGSKNLKAIVVNGKGGRVKVAFPERFKETVNSLRKALYEDHIQPGLYKYGTARDLQWVNEHHSMAMNNFQNSYTDKDVSELSGMRWEEDGYLKRRVGCATCIYGCHRFNEIDHGKYKGSYSGGPEAGAIIALGPRCGIFNVEAVMKANELCNDLGLDVSSAGGTLGWLMESYQRKVVGDRDLGGIEAKWGNEDAVMELLVKIAKRQGIGDILAEGSARASRIVGGDSWKWAPQARGLEQTNVELRGALAYALAFAVNPRGPDHLHTNAIAQFGGTPEAVKLIKRVTGNEIFAQPRTLEKRAEIVRWHEDIVSVCDSLGICIFSATGAFGFDEEKAALLFEYCTGIPINSTEIMKAGRRIIALERCINLNEGHGGRKDDLLPWRIMNEQQQDLKTEIFPDPVVSRHKLDIMLDEYYRLHNWDVRTGKPTKATLSELGLEFTLNKLTFNKIIT